jgi:hypothetical protein
MLIAVLAMAAAPVVAPMPRRAPVRVTLEVSSPQQRVRNPSRRFSATKILDLRFDAVFDRALLPGDHTLELRLFTPSGHLYQAVTVPFSGRVGVPPRGAARSIEGYPRAVAMAEATSIAVQGARGFKVGVPFPVAGTWIVSSSLYGTWRAEARVDQGVGPAATVRFSLRP